MSTPPLVTADDVLQQTDLQRWQREREALLHEQEEDNDDPDVCIQRQALRQIHVEALDERIRRAKLG